MAIVSIVQTEVHQTIPNDCMAPIEKWLLTHILDHEPDGDGLYFFVEISPHSPIFVEEARQLFEAIEASRGTCPELCAAVEQAIRHDRVGAVWVDLDEIEYPAIFQSIVKRHPDRLPYISIEENGTRMGRHWFGGSAILITPDAVELYQHMAMVG
jgi:hypothetical protein